MNGKCCRDRPGHGNAARQCGTHAVIKARVVGLREGHHELARALVARIHFDARLLEPLWVHQRHQLEEQVWLGLEQVWSLLLDRGLELLGARTRDAVPRLRFAPMH